MIYSGSAPVRQPLPKGPEHDLPVMPQIGEPSNQSVDSVLYARLLWQQRRLLAHVGVYGFLASTLLALVIPLRFESTARLMPPDNQPDSGLAVAAAAMSGGLASSGGLGGIASDVLGLKSTSDQFVGILRSRTVQDKLINEFDLKKLYGDGKMEDVRKDLANHTDISVDRKSQIISITVADKNPQRAAAMGRAYVEELNRLVAELSTSSARRERIFLEERLKGVNQDLEAAEKNFSQFASKNAAIDVKEQGKAMVEAAAMLQGQIIAAQSQYEGLREIYTDSNYRVMSLKARIDEMQHQLARLGGKGENGTANPSQPDDSTYPSIRKLPLLGVPYADLYRATRVQEAVFETLTKEYEMAKVQEAKEIPTVKVLDAPNIPDKKSFPPRTLIVLLGTAFGLVIATIWIVGTNSWEQTDSADPRKVFAQEVFSAVRASIPGFAKNGVSSNGASSQSLIAGVSEEGLGPDGRKRNSGDAY